MNSSQRKLLQALETVLDNQPIETVTITEILRRAPLFTASSPIKAPFSPGYWNTTCGTLRTLS